MLCSFLTFFGFYEIKNGFGTRILSETTCRDYGILRFIQINLLINVLL